MFPGGPFFKKIMKKIKLGKFIVEIYDSISELPVVRYHAYSKMMLIDAGVGSDIGSLDAHLQKAISFMKDDPAKAVKELDNLRQNVFLIQSEVSPRHLAFCALVKTVDGVEQTDLTTEGLQKLATMFGDVIEEEVTKALATAKKKNRRRNGSLFSKLFQRHRN